ncbi:MAG: flagellar hook capping FlgD N-terminal domain-containing protein [Burkholderiaceae bacterium]|jgi:flagellar basal-body rod modification protein FlgD|nr:flagellar hook capping FlgD N-terminal domain-containing protein [Burkholderiaceae bacterium]
MIASTQNDAANRAAGANASANAAAAAYGAPTDGTETADGTEDRFLKLLVAQMRNQDPLNPLDNAQVTSQLAQINTVRGIEQLNASMTKVAAASTAVSPLSAVGLLGRRVLVEGDRFEWSSAAAGSANNDPTMPNADGNNAKTVRVGFELPVAARAVRVEIVDDAGRIVHARDFAEPQAGVHTIDWDGVDADGKTVVSGKYRLRAYGVDEKGGESRVVALVPARVNGVSQAPGGARLDLIGREAVAASAIRAVL